MFFLFGFCFQALPEWEHTLLYEALLPLFQEFAKYYDKQEVEQYINEHRGEIGFIDPLSVAMRAADQFEVLWKAAVEAKLDDPSQEKKIRSVREALVARVRGDPISKPAMQSTETDEAIEPSLSTGLKKQYEKNFQEEETHNVDLNRFAYNFRASYCGSNTLGDQLVHVRKDFLKKLYLDDPNADDALPMGREFQNFVRCFVEYHHGTRRYSIDNIRHELSSLVRLLQKFNTGDKSLSNQQLLNNDLLIVKCMKILRALLYNEQRQLPEDYRSDDPYVIDIQDTVAYAQNTMNYYAVVQAIVPLVASTNVLISTEVRMPGRCRYRCI